MQQTIPTAILWVLQTAALWVLPMAGAHKKMFSICDSRIAILPSRSGTERSHKNYTIHLASLPIRLLPCDIILSETRVAAVRKKQHRFYKNIFTKTDYFLKMDNKQINEQKPRRCVIIGGADINNYNFIRKNLNCNDFTVFCDSGLKHLNSLQLEPDLIVGDFDSHENPHLNVETIEFPCEKDDTDTMFAVKEAVKRGFKEFLLIGVVGARLDHTIGNVSILLYLDSMKKKGRIIDDYSEMEIVSGEPVFIDDSYAFFSLLNISGYAKGITIRDAKYLLENAEITSDYQYGISNEVLPGRKAMVSVKYGKLLLIKIY